MISASPIAGCPSFKFLTMQMQPSASCARMWTVLSATIMFADKPHRLNERTSAQRFCVLTILPPVTALAVGLPAQRFRALAPLRHADCIEQCPSLRAKRKTYARILLSLTHSGHSKYPGATVQDKKLVQCTLNAYDPSEWIARRICSGHSHHLLNG